MQALAYADEDVPLGNGRFMMEPMVLARLLQAAALRDQERVLVVGAGTGYGAAVLAACGCQVTALGRRSGPAGDRSGGAAGAKRLASLWLSGRWRWLADLTPRTT